MGPFLRSIQHPPARPSDRGPRNGWGRGPSKVEPLMGPTAQGCTFPQPLFPPRQTPCAVTPLYGPPNREPSGAQLGQAARKNEGDLAQPQPSGAARRICAFQPREMLRPTRQDGDTCSTSTKITSQVKVPFPTWVRLQLSCGRRGKQSQGLQPPSTSPSAATQPSGETAALHSEP